MTRLQDYSLAGTVPSWVHVQGGYVTDQAVKGLVLNVPTPRRTCFAVRQADLFFAAWRERRRQHRPVLVLVEHPESDRGAEPAEVRVRAVDGGMLILADPLPFDPRQGLCVALVLGIENKMVDSITAEKWEKEEGKIRWI
jgi:hypothetical protein